jgi:arylsulfatase A-like enzyme
MTERPNVLLIVFDTARADACSPYSASAKTPALAQLASRGTAYPNAIAPSCWTVPSHAAMFLGGSPRSVGICAVAAGNGTLCVPVIESQLDMFLPEVMRRSGYRTQGVSANGWISRRNGFAAGFDDFREVVGPRVNKMAEPGTRAALGWYRDALRARADDGAEAVERILDDWLGSRTADPFFCFVNLVECHSPYMPPKPFNDYGAIGRLKVARDARRHLSFFKIITALSTGTTPPAAAIRRMRHMYDASVAQMDAWLGRVLEALDRRGVLDETLVVVTSDHGENFGENAFFAHAASLDDRLLRVPLVMAGPGVAPAPHRVFGLDGLPGMIAELSGVDHPWERSEASVAVAQYDGPVDMSHPAAEMLRELSVVPDRMQRLTQRYTCATDGTIKLVRCEGETVLYDLSSDPLEAQPRPVGDGSGVEHLQRALDKADRDARDATRVGAPDEDMPSDLEERMRLLGYL